MNGKTFFLFLILSLLAGCTTEPPSLRPAQLLKNFDGHANQPLVERLVPVPDLLLDELRTSDRRPDYRSHSLTSAERAAFTRGLDRLPAPLKRVLEAQVIGISFIDGFAGGGMTWGLHNGPQHKEWLLFNAKVLSTTLSEWLTYRDNTAFVLAGSGYRLEEIPSTDLPAVSYLVLHEASHVYDFLHGVTPQTQWGNRAEGTQDYLHRQELHFYDVESLPKVAAGDLPEAFTGLMASGSPSFYGSQTSLEDWAELVTYGLLKRDQGIEITLALTAPDGTVQTFTPTSAPAVEPRMATALARLTSEK